MNVSATEAKDRLDRVPEQARTKPVFFDKAGRRSSVVLSIGPYERLIAASATRPAKTANQFDEQHKAGVDSLNRHVDEHGLWRDELRVR